MAKLVESKFFKFGYINLLKMSWYQALLIVFFISVASYFIPQLQIIRWWPSVNASETIGDSATLLSASAKGLNKTKKNNNESNKNKYVPFWTLNNDSEEVNCNDVYPIEDPNNNLNYFYDNLNKSEKHESITRIIHYGDSLIAGDWVTGTLREQFQADFGKAGSGFVLPLKGWRWYGHKGIRLQNPNQWNVYRLTRPNINDKLYGLGGVTFINKSSKAEITISASSGQESYPSNTNIYIFAHASPESGNFSLYLDNNFQSEFSTKNADSGSTFLVWNSPAEFRELKIKVLNGKVRIFGIALEYNNWGIVYDSLGILGAQFTHLLKMSPDHWIGQLKARNPSLVIFQYGTNESASNNIDTQEYYNKLIEIIKQMRSSMPSVSCLIMSPMDRAMRIEGGNFVTMPVIKEIINVQHRAALDSGCAYWNTFLSMGGEGSMAQWGKMRPRLASGDFTHPTLRGAEKVAKMFYCAIKNSYNQFKNGIKKIQKNSVINNYE